MVLMVPMLPVYLFRINAKSLNISVEAFLKMVGEELNSRNNRTPDPLVPLST